MSNLSNISLIKAKLFIRERFPFLMEPAMKLAASTVLFKEERDYLKGRRSGFKAKTSPLILLSQQRAGTQITEYIIRQVFNCIGQEAVNLPKYSFWKGESVSKKLKKEQWIAENCNEPGYFYGALGPFSDIASLPDCKYLLMLRDPRDVVVSHYFSIRDAHLLNSQRMVELSKEAKSLSIDEYVLADHPNKMISEYLEQAQKMMSSDKEILFMKYEDLMSEPKVFVQKLCAFLGVTLSDEVLEEIIGSHFEPVEEENRQFHHKRSGAWGQFKTKLSPESQSILWDKYGEAASLFGYAESSFESFSASRVK